MNEIKIKGKGSRFFFVNNKSEFDELIKFLSNEGDGGWEHMFNTPEEYPVCINTQYSGERYNFYTWCLSKDDIDLIASKFK